MTDPFLLAPCANWDRLVTQTFDEHIAYARTRGWCYQPGPCPSGTYYYGGLDIGIPIGTPVVAAADGVASKVAADKTGYGAHVMLSFGDYVVVYGHLSATKVLQGQRVTAGTVLGLSGSTGFSTGPHLHWEVRYKGIPVDPVPLILRVEKPAAPDPAPVPPQVVDIPLIPQVVVVVSALRIRRQPVTGETLGYHAYGDRVLVIAAQVIGKDVWYQVVNDRLGLVGWSAAIYQGQLWVEVIGQ